MDAGSAPQGRLKEYIHDNARMLGITATVAVMLAIGVWMEYHPYHPPTSPDIEGAYSAASASTGDMEKSIAAAIVRSRLGAALMADQVRLNELTAGSKEQQQLLGAVDKKLGGVDSRVQALEKWRLNEDALVKEINERLKNLPALVPMSALESLKKEVADLQANFPGRAAS